MAFQIDCDELKGCKTYLGWILDKIDGRPEDKSSAGEFISEGVSVENYKKTVNLLASDISRELCRVLFETDFRWSDEIVEDEIRAKDALEVRKEYANEIGKDQEKSKRDTDRIWKSILGKTSVLEVIFRLCMHLDEMTNEGEPGSMIWIFYRILINNLGLDSMDDEDFDHRKEDVETFWNTSLTRFLDRTYAADGSGGGLFPIREWSISGGYNDQKKVPIWDQMNIWLGEHLDDDGFFKI